MEHVGPVPHIVLPRFLFLAVVCVNRVETSCKYLTISSLPHSDAVSIICDQDLDSKRSTTQLNVSNSHRATSSRPLRTAEIIVSEVIHSVSRCDTQSSCGSKG
ncbi:hypothetical protein PR003_g4865 [Phytophthora rubi]|uniref:Secreted protein n=1 Tax=Phytophthora rubi TaxID=129364 RepID=A0A6A3KLD1_9STRA|nr:hypothetical protein PR001_g16759 [Phytophthora rubi]KAE9351499.1 hypothetical protein PR003_g4865 [Phytophthora rubi]